MAAFCWAVGGVMAPSLFSIFVFGTRRLAPAGLGPLWHLCWWPLKLRLAKASQSYVPVACRQSQPDHSQNAQHLP